MFADLAPQLDTRTLISYVVTLQGPDGHLLRIKSGLDGWQIPLEPVRHSGCTGDLFLFASARCLHRVAPVLGSKARVTMGGFLALTKDRSSVLYWS